MLIKGHIEARPWKPQDLLDDLQKMIDEESGTYLNNHRTTHWRYPGWQESHSRDIADM